MTGWRIGYAGGPVALIRAMGTIQSQSTSNPCSVSQYAALEALSGPQEFLRDWRRVFRARRDLVVSMLNQARRHHLPEARGRLYVYPDIAGSSARQRRRHRDLERRGLRHRASGGNRRRRGLRRGLGVSPNFRVSYATSDDVLREACSRIQRFCAALV